MAQCIGKQKYCDLEVAKRVAQNYTDTNYQKRIFRVYPCKICDGFHLTSTALRGRR